MSASHHEAGPESIDARTLYSILRLRVDVFVVEQECPYPDLDGRDLEPGTLLLWTDDGGGQVAATLRVLQDGDDRRIGRVATARRCRGLGYASALVARALEICDGRTVRLDAQSHLENWYAGFGFIRDGAEFIEDGIAHRPMILAADRGEPVAGGLSRA